MDLKTPNIVPGEASETDEDEEADGVKIIVIENGPNAPPQIQVSPQRKSSVGDAEEAFEEPIGSEADVRQLQLQQIINERCISLLNEFIHTTAVSVSKQLIETDNLLMKSQVDYTAVLRRNDVYAIFGHFNFIAQSDRECKNTPPDERIFQKEAKEPFL